MAIDPAPPRPAWYRDRSYATPKPDAPRHAAHWPPAEDEHLIDRLVAGDHFIGIAESHGRGKKAVQGRARKLLLPWLELELIDYWPSLQQLQDAARKCRAAAPKRWDLPKRRPRPADAEFNVLLLSPLY